MCKRAQRAGGIVRDRAGRLASIDADAVDVVRVDGYRSLRGLPYMEAAHRGGDHDVDSAAPGRLVCVSGGSASVGWTRRPSAGARKIERFAGLSAAAGRCESPALQTRDIIRIVTAETFSQVNAITVYPAQVVYARHRIWININPVNGGLELRTAYAH